MGIEQVQKIHEFGEINVVIVVLLVAALVIALKAGWEKLLEALGLETKTSLRQKEIDERMGNLESKLNVLETNQAGLSSQITDMSNDMKSFITSQNQCTIASFRSALWRMHRDFMSQGYITPEGLKTFLEMGKLYETAGGNDIYHEKLLPDIESLEVRYTKDSVL